MITKNTLKSFTTIAAILLASFGLFALLPPKVQAASVSPAVTVDVAASCVGIIDGQTGTTYTDIAPGSDVSLNVTNNNGVVSQSITGPGIGNSTTVGANNKSSSSNQTMVNLSSVTSPLTVTFTPIPNDSSDIVSPNNCPTSGASPTPSYLVVNPASASLSCTLSGSSWSLAGSFNGFSTGSGLFNGSTEVASITGAGNISQVLSASSSASTLSIIDGLNYGAKGTVLASASCPAYTPVASSLPKVPSGPTSATSTPASTSTPATTPAAISNIPGASANKPTVPASSSSVPLKPVATKLDVAVASFVSVIVALVFIGILLVTTGFMHIKPDKTKKGFKKYLPIKSVTFKKPSLKAPK